MKAARLSSSSRWHRRSETALPIWACQIKAAVLLLTRVADKEYRGQGIRVIGLSPGTVATEMQVQIKASGINPVSQLDPSAHIPPEWVARAIAWLAGPEADGHRGKDFSLKPAQAPEPKPKRGRKATAA